MGADNQQERSKAIQLGFRNPQRLYARHPSNRMKIESELHGDMQRPAETTGPVRSDRIHAVKGSINRATTNE